MTTHKYKQKDKHKYKEKDKHKYKQEDKYKYIKREGQQRPVGFSVSQLLANTNDGQREVENKDTYTNTKYKYKYKIREWEVHQLLANSNWEYDGQKDMCSQREDRNIQKHTSRK